MPMQTIRRSLVAAVLAAMVLPAAAQDVTPSHLAAARAAVRSINTTDQFDNILPTAATEVKSDLIGSNPDLQAQISEMVDNKALELAPRRADLETEIARIYAKTFTEEELTAIAQFYGSPAGQKLLSQGPIATREMVAAADLWSNGIVRDLRKGASAGMTQILSQNAPGTLGDGTAVPTTGSVAEPAAAAQ